MTEQEWTTCTDPDRMLGFLPAMTSDRKLRLFACACCRTAPHLTKNESSGAALEVAENLADEQVNEEARRAAVQALGAADKTAPDVAAALLALSPAALQAARETAAFVAGAGHPSAPVRATQADLLRDLTGNPFTTVSFRPSWLTPAVVVRAHTMYQQRRFDEMPSLASALEKAGCDDDQILAHCRGGGIHVRGCWVLDLLLGKG